MSLYGARMHINIENENMYIKQTSDYNKKCSYFVLFCVKTLGIITVNYVNTLIP